MLINVVSVSDLCQLLSQGGDTKGRATVQEVS